MSLSRRFVLQGLGASMAIPVLPSLLSAGEARAQAASNKRCFVMYATQHGGVWTRNMYPALPTSGVQTQQVAGRAIRRFELSLATANGVASLSPALTASSARFTERLKSKMFTLLGLDIPWYIAHHSGGYLGNFARNDGNGGDGTTAQNQALRRTIDQIMAYSPAFYPDLAGVRERVLLNGRGISYNHANPTARTGAIQEVSFGTDSPQGIFDRLFPMQQGPSARPLIVDRVLENYRRLRGSPRISAADKARLDEHLQRVDELQRRLGAGVGTCLTPTRPPNSPYGNRGLGDVIYNAPFAGNPDMQAGYYKVINDLIVAAFSCGVTRIAALNVSPNLSPYSGDWHQDVAHQANQPDGMRQGILLTSKQKFFEGVFLDLASKLDAVDAGDGKTLLDRSLAVWQQESGNETHSSIQMPVVGFGSADGFLRTGQAIDYRNLTASFSPASEPEKKHPGLLWQQWLGTVLQAMGVPKSEWENPAVNGGYPDYNFMKIDWAQLTAAQAYTPDVWAVTGEVLPMLKA